MVAFVRATSIAIAATSTKIQTNFTTAVASGNAVIGYCGYGNSSATAMVSVGEEKTGASSGTVVQGLGNAANNQAFSGFYFLNVTNSASSFTASFNGALGFRGITLAEYSGLSTVTAFEVSKFASTATPGTGANAISTGNTTTAFSGDLIFGGVTEIGGSVGIATVSSGAGYTFRNKGTSVAAVGCEDVTQPAAGVTTVTWTDSVNGATGTYVQGLMAFKASSVAAGAASRISFPWAGDNRNGMFSGQRLMKNPEYHPIRIESIERFLDAFNQ